jgi:hypothetical protein
MMLKHLKGMKRRRPVPGLVDMAPGLWEYDEIDLRVEGPEEQAVAVIRDLLLERVTTGWDLDGFEPKTEGHHFVFKRPVATC